MSKAVIAMVLVGLFLLFLTVIVGQFLSLYVLAMMSNARVGPLDIIRMRLHGVDIRMIVFSRIRAMKSGFDIPTSALESHHLAGGRVPNVISALIASRAAGVELSWEAASAVDLAGGDILRDVLAIANPDAIRHWSPAGASPEASKSANG